MEQKTLFNEIRTEVYIHKLSGEKMIIKKLFGDIALCECETTTVITEKPYLATKTAICNINNLKYSENDTRKNEIRLLES